MANRSDQRNGLEADVRELENRMYQVEDVLRTLQEELSALKRRTPQNEFTRH